MPFVSIVIPALNEEENIPFLTAQIYQVFSTTQYDFEIIVVNDGSSDNTIEILHYLASENSNFFYVNLSRTFGQQNALRAGYNYSRGDVVICMDADMQNPPALIIEMVNKWKEGFEIVLAKRKRGKQKGIVKEFCSRLFYRIFRSLSEKKIEMDVPDFRLLDRKLVRIINSLPENDMFLRGIVPWLGFKTAICEYDHGDRANGSSKYSPFKMIRLAISGITGFSVKPLHLAIYIGLFFSCLALLYIPYVFVRFYSGHTISGWSSLIVMIIFLGGLQLFILGLIGLYLGKMFMQIKMRPSYIVSGTNTTSFSSEG